MSCPLQRQRAKRVNLLTTHQMGPVGFMKASFRSCGLFPKVAGVKGKLSPVNSVLGWLQACADVGGKGSELNRLHLETKDQSLIGCILQVSLQHPYSLSCWLREQAALSICVCGAGLGCLLFQFKGEKELILLTTLLKN